MMEKKILVTGGAGFIGGNFVHYMVDKYPNYMIVNLDALTYAGNLETCQPVEGKPNYKFVKGDIADRDFIFNLFKMFNPICLFSTMFVFTNAFISVFLFCVNVFFMILNISFSLFVSTAGNFLILN